MPRRKNVEKKVRVPDAKYNNLTLAELINKIMYSGKKSTAESIIYSAMDIIQEKEKNDPILTLELALKNATPLLEVKALGKTFFLAGHRIDVLKDLNLDVFPKDTLAVVGASGAGKSTLLHILGTLDRPTAGVVLFEGQNLYEGSPQELAGFRNGKIGFVFQFHHLLPEFSTL